MKRTCGFNLFNKKGNRAPVYKTKKGKNAIIRTIMLEALKNKSICPRRDDYILIDGEKCIPLSKNNIKSPFAFYQTTQHSHKGDKKMREQKLEIIIIKALYKCDPTKNIECTTKGVCLKNGGFCETTSDRKYAERDENGMAIPSEEYLEYINPYIRSHVREGTAVLIKP